MMADTSYEPLRLYCGEWLEDEKRGPVRLCNAPAEFLLWGKLIDPEGLGPRCYDHAAKHIGHHALTPHGLTQYALLDLRGLARRVS